MKLFLFEHYIVLCLDRKLQENVFGAYVFVLFIYDNV